MGAIMGKMRTLACTLAFCAGVVYGQQPDLVIEGETLSGRKVALFVH
jgi:hypothetical protein